MNLNSKGQTLVEALVALGAAVLIISSIAVAVITSVNNADFSKTQNLATQYAQQAMDNMRHQSESSWIGFATRSGTFCFDQGASDLGTVTTQCTAPNINTTFIRQITITQASVANPVCNNTGALVSVIVKWADGKCTSLTNHYCHLVKLDSCLANINSVSAP